MDATISTVVLAPLDSARVVSTVYSLSLVSVVPFVAAAVAAAMVRRLSAGTRALVWRAAIVTLLIIAGAQLVPFRWEAWVLPAALADPLIAIGREAMRASAPARDGTAHLLEGSAFTGSLVIPVLGAIYLAGVARPLPFALGVAAIWAIHPMTTEPLADVGVSLVVLDTDPDLLALLERQRTLLPDIAPEDPGKGAVPARMSTARHPIGTDVGERPLHQFRDVRLRVEWRRRASARQRCRLADGRLDDRTARDRRRLRRRLGCAGDAAFRHRHAGLHVHAHPGLELAGLQDHITDSSPRR